MSTEAPDDVSKALPAESVVVVDADQIDVPITARFGELEEKVLKSAGVSSLFFTILLGAAMIASVYALNWLLNIERLRIKPSATNFELAEMEDGEEEGKKGDAPDLGEVPEEMPNREETPLDTAPPDLADDLLQMIQNTDFTDPLQAQRQKGGSEGGAGGYGEKGKGFGKGGSSRAQRWVIEWGSDTESGYKKKLDFFKIFIGAVRGGQLVGAARGFDTAPREQTGTPPNLWFVHQDKTRVDTDRKLLQQAGVSVSGTDILCQFYPPDLQARLVEVETKHQNKRENEIKKTVFGIRQSASGYELYVIEQTLN
jgi:hypothetical protein